jgi:DNA repair protein RecO (recombination protein O)
MRNFKTEGIILKRRNAGEADRILTVLTKYNGKIQVKATGVRKISSKRAPHVELINLSELSLYKSSRSFMPILTEVLTIQDFPQIKKDLKKVGFAYYICELIDAFCPENQESTRIFILLHDTFSKLCKEEDSKQIIYEFEKELLCELGFWSRERDMKDKNFETLIESLLERKLRTKKLIQLLH